MSTPLPEPPFALFDDNLADGGDLLLTAPVRTIECNSPDTLADALARIEEARSKGHWVALAACYELGAVLEPRLRHTLRAGDPLLSAWVFERAERLPAAQTAARIEASLALLPERERIAGVAGLQPGTNERAYMAQVDRIRDWIVAGDCYQVNLTFASHGQLFGSPLALYRQLRDSQPVRYGALISHAHGCIASRSPELFVERNGERLVCRPMKGTASLSAGAQSLKTSVKDRAENVMIVDLIRNDLGRLAPPGGVRVERLFETEGYRSVWQMTSTVVAQPVQATLQAVLNALFPCGSITGAPKIRAMEIIAGLEQRARGLYCGALGWIAPDGDFRFSVPIRTLVLDEHGRVEIGLGSGIVHDSVPEMEWQECLLKGRFLADLDPGFRLMETLRRVKDEQPPYPMLDAHLRRLRASATYFGFAFDETAVRDALHGIALPVGADAWRVRLTLGKNGDVAVQACVLAQPMAGDAATVVISPHRLHSGDPLLRHKVTARALYDDELVRVCKAGHFDALFFNERDELCEGARSNVFLRIGGRLLTPPLRCGLLDGVLRRQLLESGEAQEQVLHLGDLNTADAVLLGNALRGLTEVRVVEAATAA